MTIDDTYDKDQARDVLETVDRARASGRRTGRNWARRYLLAFGAMSSGSLLATWAVSPWISQEWWGLWYGLLAVLLGLWARRQLVRAVPRRLLYGAILVWTVIFGLTMAIAIDQPLAYPVGAVAGFAVWAAAAWWVGR
jgi:hypothetical protein